MVFLRPKRPLLFGRRDELAQRFDVSAEDIAGDKLKADGEVRPTDQATPDQCVVVDTSSSTQSDKPKLPEPPPLPPKVEPRPLENLFVPLPTIPSPEKPLPEKSLPPEMMPPAPSPEQAEVLIERAFGKDSPLLKRPVRFWVADLGVAITAEKNSLSNASRMSREVQLTSASVAFIQNEPVMKMIDGDRIVISLSQGIGSVEELRSPGQVVSSIELHRGSSVITLTPQKPAENGKGGLVGGLIGSVAGAVPKQSPDKGADVSSPDIRFRFNIDAKTSLTDLLPAPPKTQFKLPVWTNEDLTKVPEIAFGESLSKDLPKLKGLEAMAFAMAKMNHLNAKKRDGFVLALLEQRSDLRGLPFLMGDECRTNQEQARVFAKAADTANLLNLAIKQISVGDKEKERFTFQTALGEVVLDMQMSHVMNSVFMEMPIVKKELRQRATVAAVTQVFMPEPADVRAGLAKHLATVPHIDATKALAKLAIFSAEHEVREAAIEGLKLRRERDYTDILMSGFRYPLPAVAKRAAEALIKLERKDLLGKLIDVFEAPDPRLPVIENRDGKEVTFVREMVKINHHRNCLLCHAPGNTENTPEGVLKVAVPLSSEPLPKPAEGGYQSTPTPIPDIVVRLDMTYLRQDFSLMMPVADAHPWPEMQRFDFLVRTRELTPAETKSYVEENEPGRLSPYHRAALFALRELTGRDTEPTPAAWRKLLRMPK